jgi:hypothetical protein
MTYSRPGNNRVSIRPGEQLGNAPRIELNNSGSKVSRNAPQRDNTNPNLIYQNGMQKKKQIDGFLEFFNETVSPQLTAEFERKAKREAGTVLDAYAPEDITRGGNQEAIDAMNSLSPRAKDFVVEAQAAAAVSTYSTALRAAYNNNERVFTPGDSPEAQKIRATAKAAAREEAREISGLSRLPAYQTTVNAQTLMSQEGQINGQLYQARIFAESKLRKSKLAEASGKILATNFGSIGRAAAASEDGATVETVGLRGLLEQVVDASGKTEGVFGQADNLFKGITEAVSTMNPREQQQFYQELMKQRDNALPGVDGSDLWNVPINDQGDTISKQLAELETRSQVAADAYTKKELGAKLIKLTMEGKSEEAEQLLANSFDLLNDPANWTALAELKTREETRVTPQMRTNQNDIDEQVLNGETTYAEAVKGILGGERSQVSRQWLESRLGLARREIETGKTGTSPDKPAFDAYKSMKGDPDNSLIDDQFRAQLLENIFQPTRGAGQDKEYTTEARGFLIEAETDQRDAYIEIYNEKVAAKDPIDPLKIYKEATARALTKFKERAATSNTAGPNSATQPLQSYGNTAQSAINKATIANGGKLSIPIEAISPAIQAKLQAQNKSWDSMSDADKTLLLGDSFVGMTTLVNGKLAVMDTTMARKQAEAIIQRAKKAGANSPGPGLPQTVPVTEQEEKAAAEEAKANGYQAPAYKAASQILDNATQYIQKDLDRDSGIPALEAIKKWFNNDGMGDQSMNYVGGFLNMITGAAPANAGPLTYGDDDGVAAFRQAWRFGSQGLKTAPLPQVAATTQVRAVPTAVSNDQHELFVMIGVAEGTRTPNGGYTKAYYGHTDPGDGFSNRGTVSGGRESGASPEMVDLRWMGTLTSVQQKMRPQLIVMGLMPGTQGYNRVMFNLMDLTVQSPAAARDFAGKLFEAREAGWTIESIAKARADSFINPATGRLDAPGFGNNYQNLIKDQRSRAGVYDYRRRV